MKQRDETCQHALALLFLAAAQRTATADRFLVGTSSRGRTGIRYRPFFVLVS